MQERELNVRFDCARQLYNVPKGTSVSVGKRVACLGEALRRLKLMRESRAFRKASVMKRGRDRTAEFRKLEKKFGFREYDLHAYATKARNSCHMRDHLDSHVVQKLATRAFFAAQEYVFGKRGKPRPKGRGRGLHSLEGKTNAAGIRWRDNAVCWCGLVLPAILDTKDKWGVQAHALSRQVKYVRLVRRTLHGRVRWYAQLVLEGSPLRKAKNPVGTNVVPEGTSVSKGKRVAPEGTSISEWKCVVGLDIGPSTIACVGENTAFLEAFCPEIECNEKAIRRIQRKLDRSRRATNPDCYNPDGTSKKGVHPKVRSNRYIRLQGELAELKRREAAADSPTKSSP